MNRAWGKLPPDFTARMKEQLGGGWEPFAESYANQPWQGLRVNRLKINPEALAEMLPFELTPVRWCPDGFTFPSGERPAKQLAYHAGLFYIQEPSAMLPAEILYARPGDRVLDICAAPGGKSVQLAGRLAGKGMLVSNDVSATRSRALVKNLELAGVTNAVVMNEQPVRLAERFANFFDKILVDAPCSGEGMFRRDLEAAKSWTDNKPEACAALQREILKHAAAMLKSGGRMVYSTCTFSETENEDMIAEFLEANQDFSLLPIKYEEIGISRAGVIGARESSCAKASANNGQAVRIWPHRADGEGHFTALLQKDGGDEGEHREGNYSGEISQKNFRPFKFRSNGARSNGLKPKNPPGLLEEFRKFCSEHLTAETEEFLLSGNFTVNGVSLYRAPDGLPDLRGLRFARSGWYMGDISKGRFTPSQALAMGLTLTGAKVAADFQYTDAVRYLKGESITPEGISPPGGKPWTLAGCMGYPLGWAKWVNERLKNYLPAGWVEN